MNQNVLQGIKIQEKYLHDIEENGESNIVFADASNGLQGATSGIKKQVV